MLRLAWRAAAVVLACLPLAAAPAAANPLGGQVVGGQATIATTTPGTLTIQQVTPRAAINWQSFNIAPNETTQFVQPGPSSIALNRVQAGDPSVIAGRLNANGQLVLINPSGVVFAHGSQVNVNSLIATPTDISTANFMAGRMLFDIPSPDPRARIVNNGSITVAQKGLAALVGPSVANNGVISARLGTVLLGGAQTYTLDFYGDGLIKFDIGSGVDRVPLGRDGKPVTSLVANRGLIDAPGGAVLLSADAASGILGSIIDAKGTISAPTYAQRPGSVAIDAGAGNGARLAGTVNVSGLGPGQVGGSAVVTGRSVDLTSTARIDARGDSGGGTVKIGGGPHGADPLVRNALATSIAAGATIDTSATGSGNGGTVAVWSDGTTTFAGTIVAKGGPLGGDGGWVETSGKGTLNVGATASVIAASPRGKAGSWLLDPDSDITITSSVAATMICAGAPAVCSPATDSSILDPAVIVAALDTGTSVTVTTSNPAGTQSGNILVGLTAGGADGQITMNTVAATTATLTLKAGDGGGSGGVFINSPISNTGNATLSLALNAGGDISFSNAVTLAGSLSATAGNILFGNPAPSISQTSAGILTANGAQFVNNSNGGIDLSAAANRLADTVTLSARGVSLTNAAPLTIGASNAIPGNFFITTTGAGSDLTLAGDVTAGGARFNSAGSISEVGNITLTAGVLQGSSVGGANFTKTNAIDTFGQFADTGAGSSGITLNNSKGLLISGIISSASGPITLMTAAGDLTINGTIASPSNQVTLVSGAGIDWIGSGIIASSLLIQSVGSATVSGDSSSIGKLAAQITGTGASLTVENTAAGLTVDTVGNVNGITTNNSAVTLTTTTSGDITINQPINAGTGRITLRSAGGISGTGAIDPGSLLIISAGSVSLTGANTIDTLAAQITGAGSSLTFNNTATNLTVGSVGGVDGITTNAGAVTLTTTTSGNITLAKPIDAGAGKVTLSARGDIAQNAGAIITAGDAAFTGSPVVLTATITLNEANKLSGVVTLSTFFNPGSDASLTNAAPLTVGTATIGGNLTLTTTGAGSNLALASSVSVFNLNTLTLNSAGTISQTGGLFSAIAAGTLKGSSVGGTSLTKNNGINNFGPFSDSAGGSITLVDRQSLTVAGALGTSGDISLFAISSGEGPSDLTVASSITAGAGKTVTLFAAGTITEPAGGSLSATNLVAATEHTGSGSIMLAQPANSVPGNVSLVSLNDAGSALNSTVSFTDGSGFTIAPGSLTIPGGAPLALGGVGAKGTAKLVSGGAIAETGVVTATTLTGGSVGGATMNQANAVGVFGPWSNTASGALNFAAGQSFNTQGAVSSAGDVLLSNTVGGKFITIGSVPGDSVAGSNVMLTADGLFIFGTVNAAGTATVRPFTAGTPITVGTGSVVPTALGLSTAEIDQITATTLAFGSGTAGPLTVSPAIAPSHVTNLTLVSGAAITLGAGVTIPGTLTLTAGGAIDQTAGALSAAILAGSSVGGADFDGANQVGQFAGFTNTGGGDLGLTNAAMLMVGNLTNTGGKITLKTTAGDINLAGDINAGPNEVKLDSAGAITQTTGSIDPGSLLIFSVGSVSMPGANTIDKLAAVLTGAGSSLTFNDTANNLAVDTVEGVVGITTNNGAVTLSTTISGNIALNAGINTAGAATTATVTLNSVGTIAQNAGVVTAGILTGSSIGGTALTGSNLVTTFGGFGDTGGFSGGISFTNAQALATAGTIGSASGPIVLTTTTGGLTLGGNLTAPGNVAALVSAGAIDQTAGVITAGVLTGSSLGGTDLDGANLVGGFFAFANTGSGNLGLTNAAPLLAGAVSNTAGDLTLTTTTGGLVLVGDVTANLGTGTVKLTAGGGITQPGGVISGNALAVTAGLSVDLPKGNLVNILAAGVTGADNTFDFLNAQKLTIGTAGGLNGVTTNGVDGLAAANILIETTVGDLAITQPVSTNGGNGAVLGMSIGQIGLQSAGKITQSGAGNLIGFALEALATGNVALGGSGNRLGGNDIGGVAATAGTITGQTAGLGAFTFINQNAPLLVDHVGVGVAKGVEVGSLKLPSLTGVSSAGGAVTLVTAKAGNILVNQPINGAGGLVTVAASGNLTIVAGGSVTGSSAVLATLGNFTNTAGGGAVTVGAGGRWLVYSTAPNLDTDGGLVPAFIQYAAPYAIPTLTGTTPVSAVGNAFLYSLAPTLTLTGVTKVYDRTTSLPTGAAAYTAGGLVPGDAVTLNPAAVTGFYADKNVNTGIGVTVTGGLGFSVTRGGVPVFGYALGAVKDAPIGTITPAALTITASDRVKTYGQVLALGTTGFTAAGLVNGDTVAGVTLTSAGAPGTAGVGGYAVAPSAALGSGLANYTIGYLNGTLTVNPVVLTAGLTGTIGKDYDGTTAANGLTAANYLLTGIFNGDNVGLNNPSSGIYATPNVGTGIGVSVSGLALTGSAVGNYVLASGLASGNIGTISPARLTVDLIGLVRKEYDGTTAAALLPANYTLSGVLAGEKVGLNDPASGNYATPDVGTGKLVSVSGLVISGPNAGNYVLASSGAAGNIGEIFALPVLPVTVDTVNQPQPLAKFDSDTIYLPFAGNFACIPSAGSQKTSSQPLLSGFGISDTTGSGATLLDKPYAAAEMQNGVLMPITFSPCQAQDLFGHVLNSLGSSTK